MYAQVILDDFFQTFCYITPMLHARSDRCRLRWQDDKDYQHAALKSSIGRRTRFIKYIRQYLSKLTISRH